MIVSGCSKQPVSEKNILDDLQEYNPFSSYLNGEITYQELSIEKRATRKDEGTDMVWINFSATTENDKADAYACLTYNLYNDGWMLDGVEIIEEDFSPLTGPDRSLPEAYLAQQYQYFQYQGEDINLDDNRATFTYKVMNRYPYVDYAATVSVDCGYGEIDGEYITMGWNAWGTTTISKQQDWSRFAGTWKSPNDDSMAQSISLNIQQLYVDYSNPGAIDKAEDGILGALCGNFTISERRSDKSTDYSGNYRLVHSYSDNSGAAGVEIGTWGFGSTPYITIRNNEMRFSFTMGAASVVQTATSGDPTKFFNTFFSDGEDIISGSMPSGDCFEEWDSLPKISEK